MISIRICYLSFLLLLHSVNGAWHPAEWSELPYMVRVVGINYEDGNIKTSLCGGSIICKQNKDDKGVILTAAHCVEAVHFFITIGCTDGTVCLKDSSTTSYLVDATAVIVHPDYDPNNQGDQNILNHDIALIILPEAITHPGAIAVNLEHDITNIADNDEITVSGYGKGGAMLNQLEYFGTNYMESAECDAFMEEHWNEDIEAKYEGFSYNNFVIGDEDFCVLDEEADQDNWCSGDSGGPLVYGMKSFVLYRKLPKQIGVVSWSIKPDGLCDHEWPTVAASVPRYYDWIVEKANCVDCSGKGLSFGGGRAYNCKSNQRSYPNFDSFSFLGLNTAVSAVTALFVIASSLTVYYCMRKLSKPQRGEILWQKVNNEEM